MSKSSITYRQIKPHPALERYIKAYWFCESTVGSTDKFQIMPDGYFDLITTLNQNGRSSTKLVGIWDKMVSIDNIEACTEIGIRFKPTAIIRLLRTNIPDLLNTGSSVTLSDWGLNKNCLEDMTFEKIVEYFNSHFLSILFKHSGNNQTELIFDQISQSYGLMPIERIAETINLSSRQIHRKVNQIIGIGAKDYAQVVRFKTALRAIKTNKANFVGYYDQAHFIKNFKHYTGLTPSRVDLNNDVRFLQYYNFEES